jgi:predicted nucleotide-binding protein (sugar kinase/HSP70/actin superfamily)
MSQEKKIQHAPELGFEQIESELHAFERAERRRLGLDKPSQWRDNHSSTFTREQREKTTILFGGLTETHDQLLEAALCGLGYQAQALRCPDGDAMQMGKEFGNRGQCNPTYYTVGNLIKHLNQLREDQGLTVEQLCNQYVFFTASSCGPCRFGMYLTEYRKALRDAGYEGFRVLSFEQNGNVSQTTGDAGIDLSPRFFIAIVKAIIAADVLNLMGYRLRPYELEANSVDKVQDECRQRLAQALRKRHGLRRTLIECQQQLQQIAVDRLQPKPKVAVIGEFFAMTTEGEANYRLQRFLESEGAEVEIQPVTNWILYSLWEALSESRAATQSRRGDEKLRDLTPGVRQTERRPWIQQLSIHFISYLIRRTFYRYARLIGLEGFHLVDVDSLAESARPYYHSEVCGGEGHMEVGKLIQAAEHNKAHLVISVKPFGCMPSSAVSDGVQSLVAAKHPDAHFLAIETSGDGAVNVYSRVQMALFKVREKAQREYEEALRSKGYDAEQVRTLVHARPGLAKATHYPTHHLACTAANAVIELAP